jgi:protein phosphatase 2C family protein 2/3
VFFAAVYDGHSGSLVSERLKDSLHKTIASQPGFPEDLHGAATKGFLAMNRAMLHKAATYIQNRPRNMGLTRTKGGRDSTEEEDLLKAGSTALVVMIAPGGKAKGAPRKLVCAWAGDSRAVLSRKGKAVQLSEDHVATREDEVQRIRDAGGTVRKGRVDNVLAVTRSFGDIQHVGFGIEELAGMKPEGESTEDDKMLTSGFVIAKPDVVTETVQDDDEFVVLASDGLFSAIPSNQAIVNFVREQLNMHQDSQLATKALIEYARKRTADNLSVVIVALRVS